MQFHTTKFNMVVCDRTVTIVFGNSGVHKILAYFCRPSFTKAPIEIQLIGGRPQIKANVKKLAEEIWGFLSPVPPSLTDDSTLEEIEGIRVHIMVEVTAYLRAVDGIKNAFGKTNLEKFFSGPDPTQL